MNYSGFTSLVDVESLVILYEQGFSYINRAYPNLDVRAYHLETAYNGVEFGCTVQKTDPRNADQIDFEDNRIGTAIEI